MTMGQIALSKGEAFRVMKGCMGQKTSMEIKERRLSQMRWWKTAVEENRGENKKKKVRKRGILETSTVFPWTVQNWYATGVQIIYQNSLNQQEEEDLTSVIKI